MSHSPDDHDESNGSLEPEQQLPADFQAVVTHSLNELGYSVIGWESDAVQVLVPPVHRRSSEKNEHTIGLSNLYRRAKGADRPEWPGMVSEFLEHITGTLNGSAYPGDLRGITDRLRPRLGRPFSREGSYPWGIPLPGTGLEINLVIDYPHTMAYVTEEMIAKSNAAAEDLLEVALGNLRAATGDDFFEQVSDELNIQVGHTGDGYDAARGLLVEDLLPDSPAGLLLAIPSRDELAVWPVSYEAISKIHVIKMFAEENFREHAYPVTDDVFWVWRGTWYRFGIKIEPENVTVSPPDEFLVALKELKGSGSSEDQASTT
jgi:hypothetical protein